MFTQLFVLASQPVVPLTQALNPLRLFSTGIAKSNSNPPFLVFAVRRTTNA
jgi:hypothetical protein